MSWADSVKTKHLASKFDILAFMHFHPSTASMLMRKFGAQTCCLHVWADKYTGCTDFREAWKSLPPMPTARRGLAAVFVDGYIYASALGCATLARSCCYLAWWRLASGGGWRVKLFRSTEHLGALQHAAWMGDVAWHYWCLSGVICMHLFATMVRMPPLPTAREGLALVSLAGQIFAIALGISNASDAGAVQIWVFSATKAIGGLGSSGSPLRDVELFEPSTLLWTRPPVLLWSEDVRRPGPRQHACAPAGRLSSMPYAFGTCSAVPFEGHIYVFGGYSGPPRVPARLRQE